jgi:hypothetical protein
MFLACIGTPIGSNVTEYVIVQIYCPTHPIVDFVTTTPAFMTKSSILNPSTGEYKICHLFCFFHLSVIDIYEIILSWIPQSDQYGPQSFCAGAIDSINLQSNQWCITYLVGFESPTIIRPTVVQGSASPIGTIFQNNTRFSIESNS